MEEIISQEEAQGLPSSELDAVENQLKWASWELHSLRHCGEDWNSCGLESESVDLLSRTLCLFLLGAGRGNNHLHLIA